MPRTYGPKWTPPPPITARDTIGAMRAFSPTVQAQANIEAMAERWGVPSVEPSEAEQRAAEARSRRARANQKAGAKYENLTARALRQEGYTVTRSQDSRGAADFVAVSARGVRLVQVKSISTFTPGCANEAVRDWLGLGAFKLVHCPPDTSRDVWVWLRGSDTAPAVIVTIDHAGTLDASGPGCCDVLMEARRMLGAWRG